MSRWVPTKKEKYGVAIFRNRTAPKGELESGIFPMCYIHLKEATGDKREMFNTVRDMIYDLIEWRSQILQKETVIPTELPLVQEVTTTLREWASIWRDLYVVRHRLYLDLDLVVRDKDGNILDPEQTSTISLFRAHEAASKQIEDRIQEEKSQKQNIDLSRQAKFASTPSFGLFVTLKNVVCKIG
ncbi:hypothetical protein CRUP_034820 [Coryphaenoides rupestris]|nr:hypothetical protein CRUP_034820 [Coryphaenoides rupestris]